jgi:F-type H+-transporting ATPase subunit beta
VIPAKSIAESASSYDSPVGIIEQVHGPVVDLACRYLPPLHQAVYAALDHERYVFEVHQHVDERHVRAITLHRTVGLRRGLPVYDTGFPVRIPASPNCLGRLVNMFGEPLDGGPAIDASTYRSVLTKPVALHETKVASDILQTGIKILDLLFPFIRGGKTGLFGGAGVG